MNITLIGDPHGKLQQYKHIVLNAERYSAKTISLGDNGFEREWLDGESFVGNLPKGFDNHVWLAGNHDVYPNKQYHQSLGDFGVWNGLFFIRGAKSIDRLHRIEGRDWFREEELSYAEMINCLDQYEQEKPEYVISHTAPKTIKQNIFEFHDQDTTSMFLEQLFQIHQPKIWIFGHFHRSLVTVVKNTTFICLNELQTISLVT